MSTEKGARRRDELVTAAADLLRSGGFDAVRHRAVAERAGLPLASTTYYFASLDELVTAAVERTGRVELAEGQDALAAIGDDPVSVALVAELLLDVLLGPGSRDGGIEAVLLRMERLVGSGRRPYLASLMREQRGDLDRLLRAIVERAGRTPDATQLRDIVSLVDGAVVSALIESDPDPRQAAREVLLRTL